MNKPDIGLTEALLSVLEDERNALLSGEFFVLQTLAERKEELLRKLADSAVAAADSERMRSAASANQTLISAALRGVRAARARIDTIRNGGASFNTYDSSGRPEAVGRTGSNVERRA